MIRRRTSTTPSHFSSIPIHSLVLRFALLGCSVEEVARNLDIDLREFRKLMRRDPEIRLAMWKGGEAANAQVAESVMKSILGYEYEEEQVVSYQGVTQVIKVKKWKEGNPEIGFKWLAAKDKPRWGNAQQVQMAQMIINIGRVEVGEFSTEELLFAKKCGLLGLTQGTDENNVEDVNCDD